MSKITHEQARNYAQDYAPNPEVEQFMLDYISQQEKRDELIELYREHKKLVPFSPGLGDKSSRVIEIDKQIKAIEGESE